MFVRALVCLLFILGHQVPFQDPGVRPGVRPEAVRGWTVNDFPEFRLSAARQGLAPSLPEWRLHGDPGRRQAHGLFSAKPSALDEMVGPLLERALAEANRYLPRVFSGPFRVWVFEGLPYAAKAVGSNVIVSNAAAVWADPARLEQLLAHEIHHVALFRSGFRPASDRPDDQILLGLLTEGVATWINASSGLFPELAKNLSDGPTL
ncbi:MAG: DUF5700 domain-containing putative Zn-dependent protease, partial [Acidobacteriota bacterium]